MDEFETTEEVDGVALPSANSAQDEELVEGLAVSEQAEDGPEEERFEEIERDGKKAKIPAWLKSELMLQADYDRQTAQLAEDRRSLDAERGRIGEAGQAEVSAQANLLLIERQIERYSKLDWNALYDGNATDGQKAFTQFQLLKDARTQTQGYLDSLREERRGNEQQDATKRRDACAAVLARDLGEWTPQTAASLFEFGERQYGFARDDLDGIDDPRAIKVLHAAYQWEEHQAKQRRAQQHVDAQTSRPAVKVGGTAPKAGLDDRLSAEEWLRRRNEQLRKKG